MTLLLHRLRPDRAPASPSSRTSCSSPGCRGPTFCWPPLCSGSSWRSLVRECDRFFVTTETRAPRWSRRSAAWLGRPGTGGHPDRRERAAGRAPTRRDPPMVDQRRPGSASSPPRRSARGTTWSSTPSPEIAREVPRRGADPDGRSRPCRSTERARDSRGRGATSGPGAHPSDRPALARRRWRMRRRSSISTCFRWTSGANTRSSTLPSALGSGIPTVAVSRSRDRSDPCSATARTSCSPRR